MEEDNKEFKILNKNIEQISIYYGFFLIIWGITISFVSDSKSLGGDLGWIEPENYLIPEIGQAIKYIELNSCSPPINSSLGFHLLWLEGIKKGGRPNTTDHWVEIESLALNKKKMDWYQEWLENSRKDIFIEIKS